jgi:hypothetical protein
MLEPFPDENQIEHKPERSVRMGSYYDTKPLSAFLEIGKQVPELAKVFLSTTIKYLLKENLLKGKK